MWLFLACLLNPNILSIESSLFRSKQGGVDWSSVELRISIEKSQTSLTLILECLTEYVNSAVTWNLWPCFGNIILFCWTYEFDYNKMNTKDREFILKRVWIFSRRTYSKSHLKQLVLPTVSLVETKVSILCVPALVKLTKPCWKVRGIDLHYRLCYFIGLFKHTGGKGYENQSKCTRFSQLLSISTQTQ